MSEHRNTSRVFPVRPEAFKEARDACCAWATENRAHYQWLLDGHPTLTDAEHRERFGESYKATRSRKASA